MMKLEGPGMTENRFTTRGKHYCSDTLSVIQQESKTSNKICVFTEIIVQ